jgi:alpha-1,3-mannosyl-glycoprotein beta-1,2-N-acetylglucosaminyltransferase
VRKEIGPVWPKEHWDHWMRLNSTSKGRECVIPQVSRNYNIGELGANMQKVTPAIIISFLI